jgi:CxxC motif-containing protein (DUF1111 family)
MARTRLSGYQLAGLAAAAGLLAALAATGPGGVSGAARAQEAAAPGLGDPLPGLTDAQLVRFRAGKEEFEAVEDAADGLGPVFNGASCAECHAGPATGGSSTVLSTQIGATVDGRFDPLLRLGGPTIQTRGVVGRRGFQFQGEVVPPQATIVARRRSNPLFGFGLVDAVPDEAFEATALIQQVFTPETAGRTNRVRDLRTGQAAVGKFGWKGGKANVFDFSADAYKDEMGITSPGLRRSEDGRSVGEENPPQGNAGLLRFNPVASPNEENLDSVTAFADFITFLAPPPQRPLTAAGRRGRDLFADIGCADCHQPVMQTGPNPVRALDRVEFRPYSDFLLHDMGDLGDGIEQGRGTGREMRTAPLWGLNQLPFFLHDGRAATVNQAIRMHDGQGRPARNRYRDLTPAQRADLLEFLDSL